MKKIIYISSLSFVLVFAGTMNVLAQPANDDCANAIDLTFALGQPIGQVVVTGPFDNTGAGTTGDPATGWACFGEPDGSGSAPSIEATIWFTFTGDGNSYLVTTDTCVGTTNPIEDGDTQIAIYTGNCGSLTPFACNEDGPLATGVYYPAGLLVQTTPGTVYYMMVDGFNFNGALSDGEFCIKFTRNQPVACTDPTVTAGNSSSSDTLLCFGDTLTVTSTGVKSPTVAPYFGVSWVISTADISATADPLNEPSAVAFYTFTSPAPSVSTRTLINDGGFIGSTIPYGIYYWTPVVFGNATSGVPNPVFLNDLMLDITCTESGTSRMVNVVGPGDPLCTVGITENIYAESDLSLILMPGINHSLKILINSSAASDGQITITDIAGRTLLQNNLRILKGENVIEESIAKYNQGTYLLQLETSIGKAAAKFIR